MRSRRDPDGSSARRGAGYPDFRIMPGRGELLPSVVREGLSLFCSGGLSRYQDRLTGSQRRTPLPIRSW